MTCDSSSPFHAKTAGRWRACLGGTEPVGLLHVVAFGFVHAATSARAFLNPMTPGEAAGQVRSWLEQPPVQVPGPGPGHIREALELLGGKGTGANLTTDAQMAGLTIEHDAVLHRADMAFARFPGLRWLPPHGQPERGLAPDQALGSVRTRAFAADALRGTRAGAAGGGQVVKKSFDPAVPPPLLSLPCSR